MSGSARLYTPELLALAVRLAEYPLTDDLPLIGEARSRSCGSTLRLGLRLDAADRIDGLGLRVAACAVGQASAAIFAAAAPGRPAEELGETRDAIERWLGEGGAMPGWPGLEAVAPARDYPARHGAMLLPWTAAVDALSKREGGG